MIPNPNQKIAELKAQGSQGINDGQGTRLQLVGKRDNLDPHSIAGNYQGTLEESYPSYIITLENPTGELEFISLITVQPQQFSEALKKAGKDLADSFEFTKVDHASELAKWKSWLSALRLTYMYGIVQLS